MLFRSNLMKNAPSFEDNPDFYHDWGDPREFTMLDRGIGECAGEVISASQFDLADAEREVFDAQLELEKENYAEADALAYQSMVGASRALVKQQYFDVPEPPDIVVEEFTQRFLDTELFYDKYAKGKFARYLLQRHQQGPVNADADSVHQLIDQAQLFIDAAHACYARCAVE